jgi:hypothetical protein
LDGNARRDSDEDDDDQQVPYFLDGHTVVCLDKNIWRYQISGEWICTEYCVRTNKE